MLAMRQSGLNPHISKRQVESALRHKAMVERDKEELMKECEVQLARLRAGQEALEKEEKNSRVFQDKMLEEEKELRAQIESYRKKENELVEERAR